MRAKINAQERKTAWEPQEQSASSPRKIFDRCMCKEKTTPDRRGTKRRGSEKILEGV